MGPLRSGGVHGQWRLFFNGGAKTSCSTSAVESCFLKTFTEASDAGGGVLADSASGKSCAGAQKAASYRPPNDSSRDMERSLNGEGTSLH